jgi:hypothetical protein
MSSEEDDIMTVNELCTNYLPALERGDLEEMLALYSE